MSPMLATTGFLALMRVISRHIKSLASADPPGLSTRGTIAATLEFSSASRSLIMLSLPTVESENMRSRLSPELISPTAYTIAIFCLPLSAALFGAGDQFEHFHESGESGKIFFVELLLAVVVDHRYIVYMLL